MTADILSVDAERANLIVHRICLTTNGLRSAICSYLELMGVERCLSSSIQPLQDVFAGLDRKINSRVLVRHASGQCL
jgi:hypothetical protein